MEQITGSALKVGTILNDKYRIVRVLGDGGFGITYLVWDLNMKIQAAIKEYFPIHLVSRDTAYSNAVSLLDNKEEENYRLSLKDFVNEAATLARFSELPGIVSVKDFFYENGTGYIVMEYIDGCSLKDYLRNNGGKLNYKNVLEIMEPVIRSLHVIHKNKLLHRDISPDNIMIDSSGRVKLIDFGASRYYGHGFDENSRIIMLKEGYAPIEQYTKTADQGAYIDVYSICATMYRMITGKVPPSALARVKNDSIIRIGSLVKKVPANVSSAIEAGLAVRYTDRIPNMQMLYSELYGNVKAKEKTENRDLISVLSRVLIIILSVMIGGTLVLSGVFFAKAKIDDMSFVEEIVSFINPTPKYRYVEEDDEDDDFRGVESEYEEDDREKDNDLVDEDENIDDMNDDISYEDEIQNDSIRDDKDIENISLSDATGYNPVTKKFSNIATKEEALKYVTIAKDGKIINHDSMSLGEVLDYYSDTSGNWSSYVDESGQPYSYYEGVHSGAVFVLEFRVDGNSFTLTNAWENDMVVDSVSKYFKNILDYAGV